MRCSLPGVWNALLTYCAADLLDVVQADFLCALDIDLSNLCTPG